MTPVFSDIWDIALFVLIMLVAIIFAVVIAYPKLVEQVE